MPDEFGTDDYDWDGRPFGECETCDCGGDQFEDCECPCHWEENDLQEMDPLYPHVGNGDSCPTPGGKK